MKRVAHREQIIARAFFWEDIYVFEMLPNKREKARGLFVFLHGFPAWSTKNYDIAEHLCLLGYSVLIPHYPGLGFSAGIFSFRRSIESIRSFLSYAKKKYALPLSLMGHSWGGYVAIGLSQHVEQNMILFAPLSRFPTGKLLRKLIDGLFSEAPDDCSNYTKMTMQREFKFLAKKILRKTASLNLVHKKILIIHGVADEVIPIGDSRIFAADMKGSARLIELQDDHLLARNRRKIFNHITRWVQDK